MSDGIRIQNVPAGMSIPTIEELSAPPLPTVRVNQGTWRGNAGADDGTVENHGTHQGQSGNAPSVLPFTAVSPGGRVIQDVSEIDRSTRFRLEGGMECGIDGAIGAGFLIRKADGSFALPSKDGALPPAEPPKEDVLPGKMAECFPKEIHQFATQVDEQCGGARATDAIASRAIEGAAGGDLKNAAKEFARMSPGLEPTEAEALLGEAISRSVDGVAAFITKYHPGTDGKAVVSWAASSLPAKEKADLARRIYFGDRQAIAQLTAAYERAKFVDGCKRQ